MEKPIVSIVIPTYNRYSYLYESIKTILTIDSNELEVIVQDNTADNSECLTFIKSIDDDRLHYFHKAEHVSVVENCDMGIMHSQGTYVCMIGDDDSVCANIVKAAKFCNSNGVEGCCFPFPGYNWSDMEFVGNHKKPNMFFKKDINGQVKIINPQEELLMSLKHSKGLVLTMPRVYHGMIARSCLDRIYNRTHTFFPGPSPDMSNAAAVCLECKKAVYISDYLIVSGYGRKSATGEGNRNQHYGRIEDKPWLPKDTIDHWDKNIPKIFSGETIIAQSLSISLKRMGADLSKYRFDYSQLYAEFMWHHKNSLKEFWEFIFSSPKKIIWLIKGIFVRGVKRLCYKKPKHFYKEYSGITTLGEAKRITEMSCYNGDYLPNNI